MRYAEAGQAGLRKRDLPRPAAGDQPYREAGGCALPGYCLMPNHVHLLIREGNEPLSTLFRRIGASHVYGYNARYGRKGRLFQDRYRSEAVDDEAYLLTVVRYIHQNPVKAGLCQSAREHATGPISKARA